MGVTRDGDHGDGSELDTALERARAQFMNTYGAGCDTVERLLDECEAEPGGPACDQLATVLHKIGGIGGMIGLPTVSEAAQQFEGLVREAPVSGFDVATGRRLLAELRQAYDRDLS
jgi:HPt (histidine-containing phosphotransfer) domain-containing protein